MELWSAKVPKALRQSSKAAQHNPSTSKKKAALRFVFNFRNILKQRL